MWKGKESVGLVSVASVRQTISKVKNLNVLNRKTTEENLCWPVYYLSCVVM